MEHVSNFKVAVGASRFCERANFWLESEGGIDKRQGGLRTWLLLACYGVYGTKERNYINR